MAATDHLGGQWWHGTPYGGPSDTPGPTGVHIGTQHAAREALNARIGHRADGRDWDGTSEYGKTMLAGKRTLSRLGRSASGYSVDAPDEDHHPQPVWHGPNKGGHAAPLEASPSMFPVHLVGPMTNTPHTPHEDFRANGLMAGQLKRGTAKRGYYYRNIAEDAGSVSAVVPSWMHLQRGN